MIIKRVLLALIFLLAFSYTISSVSATDENDIDYIEDLGDGTRIIYYKDCRKYLNIQSSVNANFETSTTTTVTISSSWSIIDLLKPIIDFIQNVVSTTLYALAPIAPLATNLAKWIKRKIESIYKKRPLPRV